MVKTSRKNLKKRNKYNSKKLNQKAGGNNPKHVIYLGFIRHNEEENTHNYLVKQLNMLESNKGKSTSILFTMTTPNLFLGEENTILKSRNTINNLITNIKLVEGKFNAGLLYRKNEIGNEEAGRGISNAPSVPTTLPKLGGSISNNNLSTSNNMTKHFNIHPNPDPLYEEIFNNPLHGIKKMQDGKNLHLIMFLMPDEYYKEYKLNNLSSLVEKNSNDYFIVLFPCLKIEKKYLGFKKEEKNNNLNVKDNIKKITDELGLKKEKTNFDFIGLIDYNYKYGVYTKNLDSNYDLQIIPFEGPAVEDSIPFTASTPLKTLKVIQNTGIDETKTMSRQCFWISIRDWYNLKNKGPKTVAEIREKASSNRRVINDENSDVILEGTGNINDTIEAFANEQKLFIRVFYYDRQTNGLNLGSDCLDKGLSCTRGFLDFGVHNIENMIIIVAYVGHFELVTQYNEGNFNYNIILDESTPLGDTPPIPLYYNFAGELVKFEKLDDETLQELFDSELQKIEKELVHLNKEDYNAITKNDLRLLTDIEEKYEKLKGDFTSFLENENIKVSKEKFDLVLQQYKSTSSEV